MNTTAPPSSPWEPVLFVSNFYDTPLEGVAHFNGTPHLFLFEDERYLRKLKDGEDDYLRETRYALYPLDPETLSSMQEAHAIFERWHRAFMRGESNIQQHPALPEDRARYDDLKARHSAWKAEHTQQPPAHSRTGEFACDRRPVGEHESRWQSFEVRWLPWAE